MYNVNILPSAWENLKSIEDYYAIQFDADTAIKVVNSILDAIFLTKSIVIRTNVWYNFFINITKRRNK